MQQLRIGREGDRFWLHRRVHDDAGEVCGLGGAHPGGGVQALLQQRLQLLFPHVLAPTGQRGAIEWQPVAEKRLTAQQLIIRVLQLAFAPRLIGEAVHVLDDGETGRRVGSGGRPGVSV